MVQNDAQIVEELLAQVHQDDLLGALTRARELPEGHPARVEIERLAAYTASPDAYQDYYRVMRGEPCPEGDLFTRQLLVKRFAGIRERILARRQLRVLDLGCLDGWCLLNLAAGGARGVGVDLSPDALATARARAEKYGFDLRFVEGTIEDFDVHRAFEPGVVPDAFDAVILSEVLEHVLDPMACLATAVRHLAPGGIVYVSSPATPIPHHGKLEDAVMHLRVLTEADLRQAARAAGLHAVVDHEVVQQVDQGKPFAHRLISFRRARVAIYCNHVTGGWDPTDKGAMAGSEEMIVQVAERWAQDGHEVWVHQNGAPIPDGAGRLIHAGVAYLPREATLPEDLDLLVTFKTLDQHEHPARVKVFWTADLPAPGQGATFLPPRVADGLDRIVCISEWHRARVAEACPWVPTEKLTQHWLGIDPAEIAAARKAVPMPVPKRAVYASSLDRGAADLLRIWPRVRAKVPGAELRVLYGFGFWKRSEAIVQEPVRSQMREQRQELERLLRQEGIAFVGWATTRAEYMREIASASVWAYPCTGGELCCKVALEMQALGVLPVVIPTMALSETVMVGVLAEGLPAFEDALIRALDRGERTSPVPVPTWADLAAFLWQPVAVKLADAALSLPDKPETLPTERKLPERFPIPAPQTIKSYGLDLLLYVAGMAFDGETDKKASLGGSETMALQLSRVLAKRGHHVTVFSNCKQPGKFDGVAYIPIADFSRYAGHTAHDVCIVQRDPTVFNMPIASKLNVLWMHDLALHRYAGRTRASMWNVDYLVPVSHWHGRQLCQVYGLDPAVIAPMRNGIESARALAHGQRRARDRKALVYAARPERGLRLLLERIFPRLLERDSELVLNIAGYDNTVPEMQDFYSYLNTVCDGFGPRVKRLGALTKDQLYETYSKSRAYLYCTENFEEVSCISLQEAAACGLPFVASAWGALPETASYCPDFARLVPHTGEPTDKYVAAFIEAAWEVISDDLLNERLRKAGLKGAPAYDWKGIAQEWEAFLLGAIEERNESPRRLAKHFWRIGDTHGADLAGEAMGIPRGSLAPDEPSMAALASVLNAIANAISQQDKPRTLLALAPQSRAAAVQVAGALGAQLLEEAAPADVDAVIGIETLDCAPDPAAYIEAAEARVRPGGTVCLVTAGPVVQQDRLFQGTPRRARWVFDQHDIRELLTGKRDLLALVVGGNAASAYDGSPLSWNVYSWKRTVGLATGTLDLERRLRLQVPRLSLTATMITHNADGMLERCVRSFRPYADEIVIADNQSTDRTREILERHGAKIVEGIDPKIHGFDECRNVVLPHVTGDMILWIDSDEELLDQQHLPKYLRWNMYGGYGLRQHHFSAVPENAFKPDLPVRLFRRLYPGGKETGIKWFGTVHEHPERAVNESVGESICLSDVHIAHVGYLTETVRRQRFNRNIPLMFRDRAKYPNRMLGKILMIRDWCHLARYATQSAGGRMTAEAAAHYEAALELFRKEFLGKTHSMALDGLQYYHEAVSQLGRGFDIEVVIKAAWPDGGTRDVAYKGRVASLEDFQTIVGGAAKELGGIWTEKYL